MSVVLRPPVLWSLSSSHALSQERRKNSLIYQIAEHQASLSNLGLPQRIYYSLLYCFSCEAIMEVVLHFLMCVCLF